MNNLVIWGYAYQGVKCYRELVDTNKNMVFWGFADNSELKQRYFVNGRKVYSLEELIALKEKVDFGVVIASSAWKEIGEQLNMAAINIVGIYENGAIRQYGEMTFEKLDLSKEIKLYAGDICDDIHLNDPNLYGLSLNRADSKHIHHDITEKYPLPDNCIYSYQAEDVLEHIEYRKMVSVINEIYRILKSDGILRICLPDYYSPYLSNITLKDENGKCIFDPTGGGNISKSGVENGGHVWFPNIDIVQELLNETDFNKFDYLCFHKRNGQLIRKDISYDNGYILRVPNNSENTTNIYSLVVDCRK